MRTPTRVLAGIEIALLVPAALFLAAVVVRGALPVAHEPARAAQVIVAWYAGRMWTLWLLLLSLPLAALVTGCAALLRGAASGSAAGDTGRAAVALVRDSLATRVIAVTTLAAAGILALVVLHMLAH